MDLNLGRGPALASAGAAGIISGMQERALALVDNDGRTPSAEILDFPQRRTADAAVERLLRVFDRCVPYGDLELVAARNRALRELR